MYNITCARRPTHPGPQADTGGRTPRGPSDARAQDAGNARGDWLVRSSAKMCRRMGLVDLISPHLRTTPKTSHQRGTPNLRSGLRGVRTQAETPPQTTSALKDNRKLLPMSPVCSVTDLGGCTMRSSEIFLAHRRGSEVFPNKHDFGDPALVSRRTAGTPLALKTSLSSWTSALVPKNS